VGAYCPIHFTRPSTQLHLKEFGRFLQKPDTQLRVSPWSGSQTRPARPLSFPRIFRCGESASPRSVKEHRLAVAAIPFPQDEKSIAQPRPPPQVPAAQKIYGARCTSRHCTHTTYRRNNNAHRKRITTFLQKLFPRL